MGCGGSTASSTVETTRKSSPPPPQPPPPNPQPAGKTPGPAVYEAPPTYHQQNGHANHAQSTYPQQSGGPPTYDQINHPQNNDNGLHQDPSSQTHNENGPQDQSYNNASGGEAFAGHADGEAGGVGVGGGGGGGGGVPKSFTPLQIVQHNSAAGWVEWVAHKGHVYDGTAIKRHFPAYMQNRQAMLEARADRRVQEAVKEGKEDPEEAREEKEFTTRVEVIMWAMPEMSEPEAWRCNGVTLLRFHGITEEELALELPPFLLGPITGRSGAGADYWRSYRHDVATLLRDMETDGQGHPDWLPGVKRWQDRYGAEDPPEEGPSPPPPTDVDPNSRDFPMEVDPETLRVWALDFTVDTAIEGDVAWGEMPKAEDVDLGDPHENFASSLRPELASEPELAHDIEGDVAWEELPDSAIRDDVMTDAQQEVAEARGRCTHLEDPARMKRRREELGEYFVKERELPPALVAEFLHWADNLEQNKAALEKLCQPAEET